MDQHNHDFVFIATFINLFRSSRKAATCLLEADVGLQRGEVLVCADRTKFTQTEVGILFTVSNNDADNSCQDHRKLVVMPTLTGEPFSKGSRSPSAHR